MLSLDKLDVKRKLWGERWPEKLMPRVMPVDNAYRR